jgi:hypothetical protein
MVLHEYENKGRTILRWCKTTLGAELSDWVFGRETLDAIALL